MDSEQIAKHEAAGCPLARELRVLRQMCSCRGDMASVDEAEARYLELRALEQREAVPVAYRWLRNGVPTQAGWVDGTPTEAEFEAQRGCKGLAEWTVQYAYATPPRDVPDAPFVERVMVRVFDGDKELTEQVFGAKFGEAVAGSKGREVPPCMVRLGTVYISPRDFVHISSTSAQLREARKAGAGAAVFVIAAAPSGEGSHG